ncbi:hypothetical protein AVEN_7445-1 [Araneus ventricosus]|uniref:Uncharacterized protein n=1 Tax=Araneus ventricosus TaxID=182803 RepID=A0A4Y2I2M3_ARAVE|nr:hypothetical protein AVEN_7445-1 [Araneus ventricosus]
MTGRKINTMLRPPFKFAKQIMTIGGSYHAPDVAYPRYTTGLPSYYTSSCAYAMIPRPSYKRRSAFQHRRRGVVEPELRSVTTFYYEK